MAENSNGNFLTISLDAPKKVSIIYRNYTKVQEVFAKIGGFFNAIILILKALSTNYLKFNYKMNILKELKKKLMEQNKIKKEINNETSHNKHLQSQNKQELQNNYVSQGTNNLVEKRQLSHSNKNTTNSNIHLMYEEKMKKKLEKRNNFLRPNNNHEQNNDNNDDYKSENKNLDKNKQNKRDLKFDPTEKISKITSFNKLNETNITKEEVIMITRDSYFEYLFKDIFCCKSYSKQQLKLVNSVLSFNNFYFSVYLHNLELSIYNIIF